MGDIIDCCLNSFHYIPAKKKKSMTFFFFFELLQDLLPSFHICPFCITVCTHTVQTYLPVFLQTLSPPLISIINCSFLSLALFLFFFIIPHIVSESFNVECRSVHAEIL